MDALSDLLRRLTPLWLFLAGVVTVLAVQLAWGAVTSDDKFVIVNDDGTTVTVTNRDNLPFGLAFELPDDCQGVRTEIETTVAAVGGDAESADGAVISKITFLSVLGEQLCSFSDWVDIRTTALDEWSSALTVPAEGTETGPSDTVVDEGN